MRAKTIVKVLIGLFVVAAGVGYFIYQVTQSSWSYYYSVDEFSGRRGAIDRYPVRIAGTVKPDSVVRNLQQGSLSFILAGFEAEVPVCYQGVVPNNFAEGREAVVQGRLDETGVFQSDILITRCEAKYKAKAK